MRDLTYICAFYLNQGQLVEQQTMWASYPPELRAHFHAIVTDDCSPERPARDVWAPVAIASYRLFRAEKNRRWDWLFCRNLGVAKATTDWVLLTDIDHVLPAETLRVVLTERLDATAVYRFTRVDAIRRLPYPLAECPPYKQHPNTWLLTRAMFDRIGGYDERFSGYYGSDSEFRERVHASASAVVTLPWPLIRYPREIIPDASTTTYGRKEKQDAHHVPRIKAERALIPNWRPLRVTLPYQLEAEYVAEVRS